jgi:hypothetical protein
MGIENIHLFIHPDINNEPARASQTRRRDVSQHIVETEKGKVVFGWDQPLMTFYFQVHDGDVSEDDNPVVWLGTKPQEIYEVEDLVRVAKRNGFYISHETRVKLYGEKDDGR